MQLPDQLGLFDQLGKVTALHVRGSQFKPSYDHWNLRFVKFSGTTPSQFQTWLEIEVHIST